MPGYGGPSALRCSICSIDWPARALVLDGDDEHFSKCPICKEPTSAVFLAPAIDMADARSMVLRARFEDEYGPIEVT